MVSSIGFEFSCTIVINSTASRCCTAQQPYFINKDTWQDYAKCNINHTRTSQENNQVACLACQYPTLPGQSLTMRTKESSKLHKKSKMADSDDNVKWFHQHCSSNYHLLKSAVPMIDISYFHNQAHQKTLHHPCHQQSEVKLVEDCCWL